MNEEIIEHLRKIINLPDNIVNITLNLVNGYSPIVEVERYNDGVLVMEIYRVKANSKYTLEKYDD